MGKKAAAETQEPLVVAITSGTVALKDFPQGFNFREGNILPANHEAVRRAPLYFVPYPNSTTEQILAAQDRIGARSRI